MSRKIYLISNGCVSRLLDASLLEEYFKLNNCIIVANPKQADFNLFISCSFVKVREEECFEIINVLSKHRGELIVLGCLPEIAPTRLAKEFKGKYLSTKNLNEIDRFFTDFKVKFQDVHDAHFLFSNKLSYPSRFTNSLNFFKKYLLRYKLSTFDLKECFNRRLFESSDCAFLRTSNGCANNCSYCSARKAIGRLKSKPIELCLKEYRDLLDKGYRNFVITANNLGAYGLDINSSLPDLLGCFSGIDGGLGTKWALLNLEPRWAISYKTEILKGIRENKIEFILCAIQSGSNRILGLMNRGHTAEDIVEALLEFKKANARLKIASYFIVGFPSEREEDHLATLEIIKKVRFNYVWFYPYYNGEDTNASKMGAQLDDKTIQERKSSAMKVLKEERIKCFCEKLANSKRYS